MSALVRASSATHVMQFIEAKNLRLRGTPALAKESPVLMKISHLPIKFGAIVKGSFVPISCELTAVDGSGRRSRRPTTRSSPFNQKQVKNA